MLLLVIKEWEAIEPYHSVCDTSLSKALADSFRDTDNNLEIVY